MLVIVEPYSSGSHARFVEMLVSMAPPGFPVHTFTLPGKKWHWRLQASSIWAASQIPTLPVNASLLVSSMLNLCELLGLRPDLRGIRSIYYMHENQLDYPWRDDGGNEDGFVATVANAINSGTCDVGRMFQMGWAQLTSMLSASVIAWNSLYNLDSFVCALPKLFAAIPDRTQRPNVVHIVTQIYAKSVILHCIVAPPPTLPTPEPCGGLGTGGPLRVCWPHRWEHDKGPELFFEAVQSKGIRCSVVVLGESFSEVPVVFETARKALGERVAHWGHADSREEYFSLLASCDCVISTANHEFFGVSTVEAVQSGCFPLCPNGLAYPEILAPSQRESYAFETASERLAQCLGLIKEGGGERKKEVDIWTPPSSVRLIGQGSGSAKRYKPSERESPYLYSNMAGLVRALLHLEKNREKLFTWRAALKRALACGCDTTGISRVVESDASFPDPFALAQAVLRFTPNRQRVVWTELFSVK